MAADVCSNCATEHHPDDVFCENCGYDFLTGSLPDELAPLVVSPTSSSTPTPVSGSSSAAGSNETGADAAGPDPAAGTGLFVTISVDLDYFAAAVEAGQLDPPDPLPAPSTIELRTDEVHIGRTSASRNIHPDLDVAALTADPAASSRHAVIRVSPEGAISLTDVGSTNGTVIGSPSGTVVTAHTPHPIAPGQPIFIGAWTRLEFRASAA